MTAEEFIKKNKLSEHIQGTTKGHNEHFFKTESMLNDYANQRVIEELERMEKECDINYLDGIEGWKITRRIKELKQ